MKWKLIIPCLVVLLLVGGFLTATWAFGAMTEACVSKYIKDLDEQMPGDTVTLALPEYHRGFLKSQGSTSMGVGSKERRSDFILKHDIYHGPLAITPNGVKPGMAYIFTTLDRSQLSEETRKKIESYWNGEEPFFILTHVQLDGGRTSFFTVNPVDFSGEDAVIKFDGASGSFEASGDSKVAKGKLQSSEVEAVFTEDEEKTSVEMDPVSVDIDYAAGQKVLISATVGTMTLDANSEDGPVSLEWSGLDASIDQLPLPGDSGLMAGISTITIPSLSMTVGDNNEFSAKDFRFDSATKQEGSLYHANYAYSFGNITGEIPLPDDADPSLSGIFDLVKNGGKVQLATTASTKSAKNVREIQSLLGTASGDSQMSPENKERLAALLEDVADEAVAGTGAEIEILIGSADDGAKASVDFDYVGAVPISENQTYLELASNLIFKANFSIPKATLPLTPQMMQQIEMLIASGAIVDSGTHLQASLTLDKGSIMTNGRQNMILQTLGSQMLRQPIDWDGLFESLRK